MVEAIHGPLCHAVGKSSSRGSVEPPHVVKNALLIDG
jgi:hypothetical protein